MEQLRSARRTRQLSLKEGREVWGKGEVRTGERQEIRKEKEEREERMRERDSRSGLGRGGTGERRGD
jgi:hypothetical protein